MNWTPHLFTLPSFSFLVYSMHDLDIHSDIKVSIYLHNCLTKLPLAERACLAIFGSNGLVVFTWHLELLDKQVI